MKEYYYVYRYGHNAPRIRHATFAEASAEAIRLAEKHPGERFEILKAIAIASTPKSNASIFYLDQP